MMPRCPSCHHFLYRIIAIPTHWIAGSFRAEIIWDADLGSWAGLIPAVVSPPTLHCFMCFDELQLPSRTRARRGLLLLELYPSELDLMEALL